MKKLLFLLGGVVTLTACSDTVFEELDEENSEMNAPPSFNNNHSGHTTGGAFTDTLSNGRNYVSPCDIWFRTNEFGDLQPNYIIANGNEENLSNFNIRVYAYVGLAYFDGTNDGDYYDPKQSTTVPVVSMLGNPAYQNLFANNQEVGNLIRTDVPFWVPANNSVRIEDKTKHLLLDSTMGGNPAYPTPQPFSFAASVSSQEQALLATYGKVFFYEVFVTDSSTNANVAHAILHPEIKTLPNGAGILSPDWQNVDDLLGNHLTGNIPGGFGAAKLYYYKTTLPGYLETYFTIGDPSDDVCDSREVVFDLPTAMNKVSLPGGKTLHLGVLESSLYGWVNSSLYLSLY